MIEINKTCLELEWNLNGIFMSKLCLGTYFAVIKQCKSKAFVQKIAFRDLFSGIFYDYDPDESIIGHMVRGDSNPSNEFIDTVNSFDSSQYLEVSECFEPLANLIDPNKQELLEELLTTVIREDESIKNETIVDVINGTSKEDMPGVYDSLASFLAGIFIYVIKNTNNKNTQDYVREIDSQFVARVMNHLQQPASMSLPKAEEQVKLEKDPSILSAKEFLLNYEKELDLLPLCQIAFACKPYHKHVRKMYTEYNLLSARDRDEVLKYCDCTELANVDTNSLTGYLSEFVADIKKYDLSADRYLYIFNQYFYRAIEYYPDNRIDTYDLYSFVRLYKEGIFKHFDNLNHSTLHEYIYDYLWYKENKPEYEIERPLDYLWECHELDSCPEECLTFWICRFIVDACNTIPADKVTNNVRIAIDESLLETQEDMYYYALVSLYSNYSNME